MKKAHTLINIFILILITGTLLSLLSTKAYCIPLVKGQQYLILSDSGVRGTYYYYGAYNETYFFLDKETYDICVQYNVPIVPSGQNASTMVSVVHNFNVGGKSRSFYSVNDISRIGYLPTPTPTPTSKPTATPTPTQAPVVTPTPENIPTTSTASYLVRCRAYYIYTDDEVLYYLYSKGDEHYFVPLSVIEYINFEDNKNFDHYDSARILRLGLVSSVKSYTFDEEHMNDHIITEDEWMEQNGIIKPDNPSIDDETYKELVRRLEEIGLDVDDLKEKYDLLDLENKAVSEKVDMLLLLFADYVEEFNASFTDSEGTKFIDLFKSYTTDSLDNSEHSYQLLQKFYGKTYRDLEEYEYLEDDITLSEQVKDLQENIVDSLTATNEKTLEELNKTLLTTNKFLSMVMVLLLITLVLALALFVGWVINTIIKRNVY